MNGAARSTILLANATGADMTTAANIATDVMNLWGMSADQMTQAVNGITGATVQSKFDVNDYALALAQAGGVASNLGVSFEDFNATIAATSSSFASGSDAGTSFKTFLQRLLPQTNEASDLMRELGLFTGLSTNEFKQASDQLAKVKEQIAKLDPKSKNYTKQLEVLTKKQMALTSSMSKGKSAFYDAEGNMKDITEVANIMQRTFSGLTESQQNEFFTTLFGQDASRTAFELMNEGAAGIEKMKAAIGDTSAEESAATRMNTLSGKWEIFQGVVETLSVSIGQKFLPLAGDIVKWATDMATAYGPQVVQWFDDLAGRLAALWIAFKQGGLDGFMGAFQKQFTDLVAYLGGVWNQYVLPPMVELGKKFLAWAGGLWNDYLWPGLVDTWNKFATWLGSMETQVAITVTLIKLSDAFNTWAWGLWEGAIWPGLKATWDNLASWITDPAKRQTLIDNLASWWNAFASWAVNLWTGAIWPGLTSMWADLTSWVTDPTKRAALQQNLINKWNFFTEWVGGLWTSINTNPDLIALPGKINAWVIMNKPELQPWIDGFATFGTSVQQAWNESLPHIQDTMESFTASMEKKLDRLQTAWQKVFGGKSEDGALATGLGKFIGSIPWAAIDTLALQINTAAESFTGAMEQFSLGLQAIDAAGRGDWEAMKSILAEAVLKKMNSKAIQDQQNADWFNRWMSNNGRASGGPVAGGSSYLVGENGPELFTPGSSGYITPNGASGRMDIYIHGESALPTDRQTIRELAIALQRELSLTGAVMVR